VLVLAKDIIVVRCDVVPPPDPNGVLESVECCEESEENSAIGTGSSSAVAAVQIPTIFVPTRGSCSANL
jgi:hypothetical protein